MEPQTLTDTKNKPVSETPRRKLRKHMKIHGCLYDPKRLLDNFSEKMEKAKGKKPDDEFFDDAFFKDHVKVAFALGLDTHNPVSESVREEYRHFLVEMTRRIEYEYDCKSAIEKSLAETIALSHIRVILLTKSFHNYTTGEVMATRERTDYYNLIGKEIERVQRQLNNSILTLRQIKVPISPFSINAKTAFIAQNQQFNNCEKPNEINERQ